MQTLIIELAGILLDLFILYRAFRAKLLTHYPLFYSYVACVLIVDAIRAPVYHLASPLLFRNLFWATQFLTLVVGYGVILEVIRKALGPYAGAERFARIAVLAIFAAVFSFVAFQALASPSWSPAGTYGELERDLRAVQVLVLGGVLTVVSYYHVAFGMNLKGIVLGYGFYIAVSLVSPALRSYIGAAFDGVWSVAQPYLYFVAQSIWLVALWNYAPNPEPEIPLRLESDYESLALKTKGLLGAMRSSLGRTVRP
jgi:hypothetical protein